MVPSSGHPKDITETQEILHLSHLHRVADRSTFDFPHSIPPRFSMLSDLKIGFENTEIKEHTKQDDMRDGVG